MQDEEMGVPLRDGLGKMAELDVAGIITKLKPFC